MLPLLFGLVLLVLIVVGCIAALRFMGRDPWS